jgi:hypothetical protein
MRIGHALVAARRAFQNQGVLTEFIAQFIDMEMRRHAANCSNDASASPSSTGG